MKKNIIRKWYVRWLCWRGKAVDIWSKADYPANVLSNLYDNRFMIDGVKCASMEAFLQSLKLSDRSAQLKACELTGKEAKRSSTSEWKQTQTVFWDNVEIKRESHEFTVLIKRAYLNLYSQNKELRMALDSTKGKALYHTGGNTDPKDTILTEREFCDVLTFVRDRAGEELFIPREERRSNVVSAPDEVFETGGGGYAHFYSEDEERMKTMTVDE